MKAQYRVFILHMKYTQHLLSDITVSNFKILYKATDIKPTKPTSFIDYLQYDMFFEPNEYNKTYFIQQKIYFNE